MGGVAREANFGQVADMEGGRPGFGFGLKEKRHSFFFYNGDLVNFFYKSPLPYLKHGGPFMRRRLA